MQPMDRGDRSHTPFGKDLVQKDETLEKFKGRIEDVLKLLEKSPSSPKSIDSLKVDKATYGTNFAAAEALAREYDRVHARLTEMSKTFGDLIEGMGLAVQAADKGYDSLDVDQAARLRAIQARLRQQYHEPEPKPGAPGAGGTPTKHGGGKQMES